MAPADSSSQGSPAQAPEASGTSAKDIAEYIALMTAELAALAGAARLDMLTYFLNMARLEAESCVRGDK
jgi:hypothetical protein